MHTRLTKLVTIAAACAAAALAAPALAPASTYCVGEPAGPCDEEKPGLQEALIAAGASGDADLVRIGPGTYTGNFDYAFASDVHIEGSGEATVIQGTESAEASGAALSVSSSGSGSRVADLEIRMASVSDPQHALGLWIGEATAENVRVENPDNSPGRAVVLDRGGDLVGSRILAGAATGISESGSGGVGQHEVRDTFISGKTGLESFRGLWSLERLEISARESGVTSHATTNLRNSLVRVAGVDFKLTAGIEQFGPGVLTAEHVTVHGGPHLTYGARSLINSAGAAAINMKNSTIGGSHTSSFARGAFAGGTANISVGHSNFAPPDPSYVGAGNGPGLFQQTPHGTNTNLDPKFVDSLVTLESPTVDFRLRHDSPLIDEGEPTGPQGQDLARGTRVVDGDGTGGAVRDMGAYEYQRQTPTAAFSAPPTATAGQAVAVDARASNDPDPGEEPGFVYAWDFGDGQSGSGPTPSHIFAGPGARTVTLTVTDPTGLTSTATRLVDVASAPAQPGEPAQPVEPAQPGQAAEPAAANQPGGGDRTPPSVSGLLVRVKGGRVARIRFRLSENATVMLRLVRQGARGRVVRVQGRTGLNRLRRAGLRTGRWRLSLVAVDTSGNRSQASLARFRLAARR